MNNIFLLGAGRSGSTLLYKLLSMHPEVGYISSYNNALPNFLPTAYINRWAANRIHLKRQVWFEKNGNAHGFQRNFMHRLMPWPVEGENIYARAGIPLFGDAKHDLNEASAQQLYKTMQKLAQQQGVDVMLSKRVANNRRIPWLKKAFPEAKFIHLVRDGRDVAYSFSQVSWWNEQTRIWWANKTMQEMNHDGWSNLSVTAKTWVEAVRTVENDLESIHPDQILRINYEDLLAQPMLVLNKILAFMHLKNYSAYAKEIESLNLHPVSPKWQAVWTHEEHAQVLLEQQEELSKWSYL